MAHDRACSPSCSFRAALYEDLRAICELARPPWNGDGAPWTAGYSPRLPAKSRYSPPTLRPLCCGGSSWRWSGGRRLGSTSGWSRRRMRSPSATPSSRRFKARRPRRPTWLFPCLRIPPRWTLPLLPGGPWVYWITPGLRRACSENPRSLKMSAQPRVGHADRTTTYDTRFLRYWWEVGLARNRTQLDFMEERWQQEARPGRRWFPYMKGGRFQKMVREPGLSRQGAEFNARLKKSRHVGISQLQ